MLCDEHGLPAELWNVERRFVGCGRCLLEQSTSLKAWVLVEDAVETEAQDTQLALEQQLTSSISVLHLAAHASSFVCEECDEAALQRYQKIANSVSRLAEHMALALQSLNRLVPLLKQDHPSVKSLASGELVRGGVTQPPAPTLAPCGVGFEDGGGVVGRTATAAQPSAHDARAARVPSESLLPLPHTVGNFSSSELVANDDAVSFSTSWDVAPASYRVAVQLEPSFSPPPYSIVGHAEYFASPGYGPQAALAAPQHGYSAYHGVAYVGGSSVAYGAASIPVMPQDVELPTALMGPLAVEQCDGGSHQRHFFLLWLNPDQCRTSVQDGIIWPSKQVRRLLYLAQETAPVILLVAELDVNNPMSFSSTLFGYAFLGERAVRTEVAWRVSGLVLHERDIASIAPLSLRRTAEIASVDPSVGERLCAFIDEEMTKRTLSSMYYPKPMTAGRR